MSAPTRSEQRDVVVVGSGARTVVRDWARASLLFGANRIAAHVPSHLFRIAYYRHVLGWSIGPNVSIHTGMRIYGGRGRVWIGRNSTFQIDCLIAGAGMTDLRIGENVAIAYRTTIVLGGHDPNCPDFGAVVSPVTIEDRVFVGANVTILAGVTMGEGSVAAAGAVVTRNVEPFTIVGGNPAKPIGQRRRDLRYDAPTYWPLH